MNKVWNTFKRYLITICKGLYRSFCGTCTTAMLALAVYGFVIVSTENGWKAVAYFVISVTALALFGVCVYYMGKGGKMLELKTKEVKDLTSVADVFKANGYEVNTYVQWDNKVGGEVLYFTVEVPSVTVMTPSKPGAWLSRVPKRTRKDIERLEGEWL